MTLPREKITPPKQMPWINNQSLSLSCIFHNSLVPARYPCTPSCSQWLFRPLYTHTKAAVWHTQTSGRQNALTRRVVKSVARLGPGVHGAMTSFRAALGRRSKL